jgi:hypothetical protein
METCFSIIFRISEGSKKVAYNVWALRQAGHLNSSRLVQMQLKILSTIYNKLPINERPAQTEFE